MELPTGKMLGMNWLVCSGGRHAFTSQVRCQIPGQWAPPTPFLGSPPPSVGGRVAQATRAPGARRSSPSGQRMEGSSFPSQRPLPGGRSPRRPAWARPRGARAAWGPSSGPCCLCARWWRPSHGLPETRCSKEAAMKGVMKGPRPRPSRDTVAANENEKGCRFGPNPSVAGDAEDTEDRPEGVRLAPSSDDRAGPAEKKRMDAP